MQISTSVGVVQTIGRLPQIQERRAPKSAWAVAQEGILRRGDRTQRLTVAPTASARGHAAMPGSVLQRA